MFNAGFEPCVIAVRRTLESDDVRISSSKVSSACEISGFKVANVLARHSVP